MDSEVFDKSKAAWNANSDSLAYPDENLARLMSGKYVDIPKSGKLLDHGFGTGNNFPLYCGYDIYGCEISKTFIDRCVSVYPGVMFREVTGLELPYESNAFNIVVSWNVIHYNGNFEDTRFVVNELHRILKPGGVLLLSTMSPGHSFIQRSTPVGDGSYLIKDENGYDNRTGLTVYCAQCREIFKMLFYSFAKVQYGSARFDLMKPTKNSSWDIVYAIK